ncbi:MAG TPA: hypothetical protein VGF92_05440 [Stellaceae bacterium]|jgi:hypothetical protein
MCGGSSSSQTSATSTNTTAVTSVSNVTTNVPITVDTSDLADALKALAGADEVGAVVSGAAQVQSAKIAASAGPSWSTIITIGGALIGIAIALHLIKVKGFK